MVRASKINELINDKVVTLLNNKLTKLGFKYQKSKRYFSRQDPNGFTQIVNIYKPYSPLIYDEKTGKLFLIFNISCQIEIPDYEKWYLDKFGENPYFSYRTESLTSQIEISFKDFNQDSFYEPTSSQKFKRSITLSLIRQNDHEKDVISVSDFLKNSIPNLVAKSDILLIYESRKLWFHNIYLLVYGGYTDLANEEFKKYYQYLIGNIETKLKVSEAEASDSIEELNRLIKNVSKVSSLSFTNPFKRSIKILNSQNDTFEFSANIHFSEKKRLDISQFKVKSININSIGDILLFVEDQKIIKLNSKGELVLEADFITKKGFDKISGIVPSGVIEGTNDFFVNNSIITSDNKILELELPPQKLKKGKLQNAVIGDLVFCNKKDKYIVLYNNNLITYNNKGQIEKIVTIEQNYPQKILLEKEWIVTKKRDTVNIIVNFEGNHVETYEYGHGNNYFEFSTNYEYLICFFYSTKSQFYDLTNGKKGTLWAHPTFLKDYKEKLYNDIEHNFGMEIAKISPDNKYIVGGACHGKYVAWTLPKLNRVELFPQTEMIELLAPMVTSRYSDGKIEEIYTKAELVTLDKQTFLKNRGNNISKIIFFENGDIFITELSYGRFVLSWDRNFNNLTYKKIEGRLDYHSQKYLTQKTNTELIIYEQI